MTIQQDRRRTGKKIKQGSREERKECQVTTSREEIAQNQDLQKKMSISIVTRGMGAQGTGPKGTPVRVCVCFPCTKLGLGYFPPRILK